MTRIEEKIYLQNVFDAIDEVYKLKKQQKSLTYEERLRASFTKLLVPNWYNHDYTSSNGLRKTKSHGQVPIIKRYDSHNNHNHGTSNASISSSNNSPRLSNGTHRHRSPSRSWSERPPLRRNSTESSYDTNGSVIINGRRMTNSNETSTYAPGMQRVAQSSTWYKPKKFTTKSTNSHSNGHSIEPPKPLPRHSKIHQERVDSTDSFSSLLPSELLIGTPIPNGNIRHPIKPRAMEQAPIPPEQVVEESSLLNASLNVSSDGDITIAQKSLSSRVIDVSSSKIIHNSPTPHITINNINTNHNINQSMTSNLPQIDLTKSSASDAESYSSEFLPPLEKNLLVTDSSSYASVNDQCLSTSTSSYHTAVAGDTSSSSSVTGYETPKPQLDDETLSLHSSISDLSHAETLEPNVEDLDIVASSTEEQKAAIISSVDVGMENLPLPPFSSTISNTPSLSSTNDNSPSNESRLIENTNWYDDGSIATCIDQTSPQIPSRELREIPNDKILHDVDMNGLNDEFFLFSSRNTTDDEPSSSISDDKHEQDIEQIESQTQTSNRLYTMENKNLNLNDDFTLTDDFHCSSTVDPFGFNNNNNNSSIMITNLDDILIDDDDDDDDDDPLHLKDSSTYLLNTKYRRPIQEDILYEVEHENSYSDHSQATSSIIIADDNTSIKIDPNLEFLTTTQESIKSDVYQSPIIQTSLQEKELKSNQINFLPKQTTINDTNTLPIYILPPLYTTIDKSSTLHIDTTNNPSNYQYSDLSTSSSPSYTSKIRHRHYSVGSYYDNKTTTVTLHPNHTLYIIGSAPVSPISRTSTTSSESHYHMHHQSPVSYGNATFNALRRINPFLETNTFISNNEYSRSSSLNRDENYRKISQTEPIPVITQSISSRSPEVSQSPSKTILTSPPPPPPQFEQEPPLIRPKTSRGRQPTPNPLPPPLPPRTTSIEKDETQNIYQEIDRLSINDDQTPTTGNADLQFIRGTIERVFDFHGESTSESSTYYEEVSEDNKNDNESISLSNNSKTVSKKNNQYPAVEAVQRFYNTKSPSDSEKKNIHQQTTNLDDIPVSNQSSTSNNLYARSHPTNLKKENISKSSSKSSSDNEQASSEEVDDTLNDIEDDDYQDEKLKRQATNDSSQTSNENSPSHSSDKQTNIKKTSQETQTLQRQKPVLLTTQSPSGSQSTVQSYETAHSSIPPLDIVTQMVIERNDGADDGQITEISGDMIIFYDDIEIVEHSSNMSSSESESTSSISKSLQNTKPFQTIIESLPPPIPARTLKPSHLITNQQQSPSISQPPPPPSSSKMNRIYELEKSTIRKKFDVNSVNDMLNRTEYNIGPTVSHRHPSARHFVGKLNNDDTSSRASSLTSPNILPKTSSSSATTTTTTAMVKSHTLPLQPVITNGHSTNNILNTPTKNSFSTLPTRSTSNEKHRSTIADTNALVKQIQNSLSRNSLHDSQINAPLSISTKDLRTFVSSTYSPSDENMIDDDGIIHIQQEKSSYDDNQDFKRQTRLSKSFHNVSEYNIIDQYPKKENTFTSKTQPSKSVENNLNHVSQNQIRHSQIPVNFPSIVASTSFSALTHSEDNARMLSIKWYTGQVSENSEICYNTPHVDNHDLLHGYVSEHSNRDTQLLLARLQASNDIRIHAALDDIRLRVAQFDVSKSRDDLHVFMRYLESRLRDINNKNPSLSTTTSSNMNEQRRISNGGTTNGYHNQQQQQQSDSLSIKSRTSSIATGASKDTPPFRQLGRQHIRSSSNLAGGGGTNGHQPPPPPPRRASQSSINQENPAVFDDMLNTVLGLPKKGVSTLPQTYPSSSQSREKSTPLIQTQMATNTTTSNKTGRDIGKRLFESGTYKDPRLIYDGPKQNEKEEQPLETSDITIDTQSIDFDVQQIATSAILTYSVTIGGANREDSVLILVELFDADGIVVVNGSNFQSQLIINKPHLCEPCGINHTHACTEQSYLYTLKVKLYNDESPRTILDVYRIEHVGIRTIRLTDSKFLVNERPFYFHGGNTNEDSDIRGRGFDQVILTKLFNLHGWFHGNAFRTIGMRNAEYFSDITLNHHKQTITEMIARDKNHPSVFIWSLANEPASSLPVAESYFSTLANFTRPIAAGRPIALVINDNLKTDLATPFYDIVCINRYFGWYTENGYIDQVTPLIFQELTNWHRKYPTKPILIIEYGAEVVPGLHNDPSLMFTEEYQKDFFAAYHLAFDNVSSLIHPDTGFFIGELVFTTFDFATEQNIKRVAGLNQKGIFTRQRQPKAGAYVINNRYEQLEQIQTVNKTI